MYSDRLNLSKCDLIEKRIRQKSVLATLTFRKYLLEDVLEKVVSVTEQLQPELVWVQVSVESVHRIVQGMGIRTDHWLLTQRFIKLQLRIL